MPLVRIWKQFVDSLVFALTRWAELAKKVNGSSVEAAIAAVVWNQRPDIPTRRGSLNPAIPHGFE